MSIVPLMFQMHHGIEFDMQNITFHYSIPFAVDLLLCTKLCLSSFEYPFDAIATATNTKEALSLYLTTPHMALDLVDLPL